MNLQNLFELQKQLDEHIEKIHPRQEGEDRLAKKILALQVELAECAQESRCFKYWSHNQDSYFASVLNRENEWEEVEYEYERIWSLLFGLAGLLGFTWEQIEQAYLEKNKINHERQESGY
ncbi:Dimeric dUTPase [Caldibacillus thermoamylovorans]|uniref:dUTP diphosphatase n=1 Tax=Caldibacillus thermoamylovorans TaxID=35841 RepID=UPI0005A42282|nr:dUTP diphosphatase [Caldibacillus thermoamylovorans]KIO62111.1 Dimeric dUTPase [Caldibacillus thermoamylovorans]